MQILRIGIVDLDTSHPGNINSCLSFTSKAEVYLAEADTPRYFKDTVHARGIDMIR